MVDSHNESLRQLFTALLESKKQFLHREGFDPYAHYLQLRQLGLIEAMEPFVERLLQGYLLLTSAEKDE